MGPGSPTYAVRQLEDSLAWHTLQARHRLGAALVFASAAVIAISRYALPVYEIYKVGEDLHWKPGLDLLGQYDLPLVFIPHWNNNDGGTELDTSRCFMGQKRFASLMAQLPSGLTVMGIEENTALILEPAAGEGRVIGAGGVTLIHTGHDHETYLDEADLSGTGLDDIARQHHSHVHTYQQGQVFALSECCPISVPGRWKRAAGYGLAAGDRGGRCARACWTCRLRSRNCSTSAPRPARQKIGPPVMPCASGLLPWAGW